MTDIRDIERMTNDLAAKGDTLTAAVKILARREAEVRSKHMARIKVLAAAYRGAKKRLEAAIRDNPDLFKRPKTRVFSGIKVGFKKGAGSIAWDDEAKVLKRIKDLLPDQAADLINTTEKPAKSALQKLSAKVLKRLGVKVQDACDAPVIKAQMTDVEKFVEDLINLPEGSGRA